MNKPFVSIIVPVYNTEKYLQSCIESIYAQTYKNFEVICVDDGSSDNSLYILRRIKKEYSNFYLLTQKNHGVANARNNAIRLAKGKYILPLDSDDYLDKKCLNELVKALEDGVCDIATPEVIYFYPDGHFYHFLGADPTPCNMAQANHICCTSLFKKTFFDMYGGYDEENFQNGEEDYDLWCRYIENGKRIKRIETALFYYRIKNKCESRNSSLKDNLNLLKKYKEIRYQKYNFVRHYNSKKFIIYKQIVRYFKRYFKYIYQNRLDFKQRKYDMIIFNKIKIFSRYF